jgi:integrase
LNTLATSRYRQIEEIPKVKTFLESISRNSKHSKKVYQVGLLYFNNFLISKKYCSNYTIDTILKPLTNNDINLYELFDGFVSSLLSSGLSVSSIRLYVAALRSYFAYYDIDVIPSKFKRKVKMPKLYREDEEPLDSKDIRKILLSCNNRRLKPYLLLLASGGMRAVEGLAIRLQDIDFSVNPTKIHIRKEYAKTKVARDIYISDEATQYLKQWIDWKYRDKGEFTRAKQKDDLAFSAYETENEPNPNSIYIKIVREFQKLLTLCEMDERKEGGIQKRRKITLHSFRRFVKTVISDQTNQDYSEWFLGHNKSPYYTKKEHDRREIYANKCMKYLTFLDYTTLEATGKNIEAKLTEKEREIQLLRQRDSMNTDAISSLSDQLSKVIQEIEVLKQQQR